MNLYKPKHSSIFMALLPMIVLVGLSACFEKYNSSNKPKDCSVYKRCEGSPNLGIRLKQVTTYYYEDSSNTSASYNDLAQFYYNDQDQWIGGKTYRSTQSNFDYTIDYGVDGKMSTSDRSYYDDEGNTADLTINYSYNNAGLLDHSQSYTSVYDSNNQLVKTIDETISYSYSAGDLVDITFSGTDSDPDIGNYVFHYEFTYANNLITKIDKTTQSNGDPDFIFKTFQYDSSDRLETSKTNTLNDSDIQIERESISYEYYADGPLKSKTSLLNTLPEQKIVTVYSWEEGGCATNQTFGDRLYPTPEVPNFPCL